MMYELIIEGVKAKPYLYQKSHPNYMKEDWHVKGFSEIADWINSVCGVRLTGMYIYQYKFN